MEQPSLREQFHNNLKLFMWGHLAKLPIENIRAVAEDLRYGAKQFYPELFNFFVQTIRTHLKDYEEKLGIFTREP